MTISEAIQFAYECHQAGNLQAAELIYKKILEDCPTNPLLYTNLGDVFRESGQLDEAIAAYQKALRFNPHLEGTYINLGITYKRKGLLDEAMVCYHHALRINPNQILIYLNLGNILQLQGRQSEALAAFDNALKIDPDFFIAQYLHCMSQLKSIYSSQSDVESSRNLYRQELEQLRGRLSLETPQDIENAEKAISGQLPFFLAYQGLNDRELQNMYGEFVNRIMAARYPHFSERPVMPSLESGEPLRVGIVSGYFYHHSVWKIPIRGWIMNIDKQRFKLYGYYTGEIRDSETDIAKRYFARFIEDISSFDALCKIIREDNLHVLLYPEIGMDPTTVRLAALKLAPIQCVSWGHPNTSGLPTMDYYLSSDMIEPTDADDHYTEKLIRLPNMSIYYSPLEMPHADVHRETFGLRQTSILYHCCQSMYKYLPKYDEVFPRIACQVGDCQFLFSSDQKSSEATEIFQSRIKYAFNRFGLDANDYAVFLPFLDVNRFNAIYNLADVFLDPIGWSGCNTALEAVVHNLPVVTFPSMLMRGRETSAILTMMGITETIAKSFDEYIEFAIKLGKDSAWRQQMSDKIAVHKHRIYHDKTCITALENFLERVAKERFEQDFKKIT